MRCIKESIAIIVLIIQGMFVTELSKRPSDQPADLSGVLLNHITKTALEGLSLSV